MMEDGRGADAWSAARGRYAGMASPPARRRRSRQPILAAFLLVLAAGLQACSSTTGAPAPLEPDSEHGGDPAASLAARYAPIVALAKDDYEPVDVRIMLDPAACNARLATRQA